MGNSQSGEDNNVYNYHEDILKQGAQTVEMGSSEEESGDEIQVGFTSQYDTYKNDEKNDDEENTNDSLKDSDTEMAHCDSSDNLSKESLGSNFDMTNSEERNAENHEINIDPESPILESESSDNVSRQQCEDSEEELRFETPPLSRENSPPPVHKTKRGIGKAKCLVSKQQLSMRESDEEDEEINIRTTRSKSQSIDRSKTPKPNEANKLGNRKRPASSTATSSQQHTDMHEGCSPGGSNTPFAKADQEVRMLKKHAVNLKSVVESSKKKGTGVKEEDEEPIENSTLTKECESNKLQESSENHSRFKTCKGTLQVSTPKGVATSSDKGNNSLQLKISESSAFRPICPEFVQPKEDHNIINSSSNLKRPIRNSEKSMVSQSRVHSENPLKTTQNNDTSLQSTCINQLPTVGMPYKTKLHGKTVQSSELQSSSEDVLQSASIAAKTLEAKSIPKKTPTRQPQASSSTIAVPNSAPDVIPTEISHAPKEASSSFAVTSSNTKIPSTTPTASAQPNPVPIQTLTSSGPNHMIFTLMDGYHMSINLGDLIQEKTEIIVNSTDSHLKHVGALSRNIATSAGPNMRSECQHIMSNRRLPLDVNEVVHTSAGGQFNDNVKNLLHVVSPMGSYSDDEANVKRLIKTYLQCLRYADGKLNSSSIAFPLLGAGSFSPDTSLNCFYNSVLIFLSDCTSRSSLNDIRLIINDDEIHHFAVDYFGSCYENILTNGINEAMAYAVNNIYGNNTWETQRSLIGALSTWSSSGIGNNGSSSSGNTVTHNLFRGPAVKRPKL